MCSNASIYNNYTYNFLYKISNNKYTIKVSAILLGVYILMNIEEKWLLVNSLS